MAEKLGFALRQEYDSFTSYPPIENLRDLSEDEWNEWGSYLERASHTEPRLKTECVFAYIKANNIEKADEAAGSLTRANREKLNLNGFICYLYADGMGARFPHDWMKGE